MDGEVSVQVLQLATKVGTSNMLEGGCRLYIGGFSTRRSPERKHVISDYWGGPGF
jgi:hypothetical protein